MQVNQCVFHLKQLLKCIKIKLDHIIGTILRGCLRIRCELHRAHWKLWTRFSAYSLW